MLNHWVSNYELFERSYALKISGSSSPIREPDPAWPWRWRHYDRSKRQQIHTRRYIIISYTACIFSSTSVRTSNTETIIYL